MIEDIKNAWNDFLNSLYYLIDSRKGLYSLDTYLEIVGQYTDRLIISAEEQGYTYVGGTCGVKKREDVEYYDFIIEMYFADQYGKSMKKEAYRSMDIHSFTREARIQIETGDLKFNIEKPIEREH